jgi:hypothetical protein
MGRMGFVFASAFACGVFACAMVAAPPPAAAYSQSDADACTPDAFRLCQQAIPDADRVRDCLMENRRNLSPACHAVFSRPQSARRMRSQDVERTKY